MKKFLIVFLTIICVAMAGLSVACNKGEYFDLTYERVEGVTFVSEVKSGAKVLKDYEVSFSLSLSEDVVGSPIVIINDEITEPDTNGIYKFKMAKDTLVEIEGVTKQKLYNVTFDKGDGWVKYSSTYGDVENGFSVEAGEKIEFTVDVSVYYKQEGYTVAANTEIIEPNENGLYSVYVTNDINVSVFDLVQESNFTERPDGGRGTAENPYKIQRPIDLFYMSQLINNEFFAGSGFYYAYYELVADIDMKGEQLFVIGDNTSSTAFFAGTFNGNGHTISNYVIKDSLINQESFVEEFLPYIGLFGYAVATSNKAPEIYNLKLDNFTIDVDASRVGSMFAVGSIVGAGIGANITACTVTNGRITADADYGFFGYAGGIIGVHQSAYDTDSMRYYATIRSCYTDVDVSADSGYAYAAGGIAGYLMSYEEKTTAFILNCHTAGNVSGAIYSGGIVGNADSSTAIIGCYSTGDVSAVSRISDAYDETFATAYAGGITGYLEYNSVLADSFSTGSISATSTSGTVTANALVGNAEGDYEFAGEIAGLQNVAGKPYIDARKSVILNSYSNSNNQTFDVTFYKNVLGWSDADWVFVDGELPTVNFAETHKDFTITVDYGSNTVNGESQYTVDVTDVYIPMSYWNLTREEITDEIIIPEYVKADNGKYSYGYFFDEQLTQQVPYGFVPTRDVTIYTGFANYNEVAGKYYIQAHEKGSGAYIELGNNGELKFVDGARIVESNYTYNGEEVILLYTAIARLGNYVGENAETLREYAENYYYSYKATLSENVLTIWDTDFFPVGNALTAVKESDTFVYGDYYDEKGNQITFNTDGTGVIKGATSENFTYVLGDGKITINRISLGYERTYDLNEDGTVKELWTSKQVTVYDAFKGTWEKNATSHKQYTFDGKGGYEYKYYGYDKDGKQSVISQSTGTYTVNGNVLTTDNNVKFTLTDEGFISALGESVNQKYYKENSFVGTWLFRGKNDTIEITFNGINAKGETNAYVIADSEYEYDATYAVSNKNGKTFITVYTEDFAFANLSYNTVLNTLEGNVYSSTDYKYVENAVFCLYDDFKGEWVTDIDEIALVKFDGLGGYNLKGTSSHFAIKGRVTVVSTQGTSTTVNYTFDYTTMTGSFIYYGTAYLIEYDDFNNVIKVSNESGETTFEQYDEWYNKSLISADGTKYIFDGKGNLLSGGSVKVETVDGDSLEVVTYTYTYKNTATSIVLYNGIEKHSTIIVDANTKNYKEVYEDGSASVILFVNSVYTGEWIINRFNGELIIGTVNSEGKAVGTYKGESVTFVVENDYMYFVIGDKTIYVYHVDGDKGDALILAEEKNNYTNNICIRKGTQDELYGEYDYIDGQKIVFDGLGKSDFDAGTVIIKNADGTVAEVYDYTFKNNGIEVKASRTKIFLLLECEQTQTGAFAINGKYYSLVLMDTLYLDEATDADGNVYTFNGYGVVTVSKDGVVVKTYSYEVGEMNTSAYTISVTLYEDGDTTGKTAKVYYGSSEYTFTFDDEVHED